MVPTESFVFFQELVETPSPSGYEQPAQRLVRQRVEPWSDDLKTDVLGNVTATRRATDGEAPRVMVTAHCDEIGLMVTDIDDKGFLSFAAIGGVDAHLVPGQRVRIHARTGAVHGVVGKKAIHLIPAAEREKVVPMKDQTIDCGFVSREDAEARVAVGDPVTFAVGLERLANNRVVSRALDNKMGAFIVTEVLRRQAEQSTNPVNLLAVTTVQEEVGVRGAQVGAYDAAPDVALVIEVGHATDTPGSDGRTQGRMELGKGPVLVRGANVNPILFDLLRDTAEQNNVPCQVVGTPGATGTDARVIQLSRSGVATALVRVPLRYMHSPVEMLALDDLENTVRLLLAALPKIAECQSFIPV